MGDIAKAAKLTKHYKLAMGKLDLPAGTPAWFKAAYPVLMQSIYDGFNDHMVKMVSGVNESLEFMQGQINDIHTLTRSHAAEISSMKENHNAEIKLLRESQMNKQYEVEKHASTISNLKDIINKNESYSRRDNLVFSGISLHKDDRRSATDVIHDDVFTKAMKMSKEQSNAIKFVRCHQLNKRPGDSKVSIMARFESYRDRSIVWTKRRSATNVYISEDFPIDVSRRRNKLKPILKEASKHKQYEHCITMRGDKLLFKGELLDVDKLHTLPTEIHPRSISELRTDDVLLFGGLNSEYHELSNFYRCPVKYKNKTFNCVEQCYQYEKAMKFGDLKTATAILRSEDPADQKYLGKKISGFKPDQWSAVKENVMKEIVHCKFSQHDELSAKLCATRDLVIGEAIKNDNYYGIGMSLRDKNAVDRTKWQKNKLGKILVNERTTIRSNLS